MLISSFFNGNYAYFRCTKKTRMEQLCDDNVGQGVMSYPQFGYCSELEKMV